MRKRFYLILTALSNMLGNWFFAWTARGIAAGYYVLFPRRTLASVRFYRALFPGRGRLYPFGCAWRQFQNFTSVFLDRFLVQDNSAVKYTFEGRDHLLQALRHGSGGILLMSHIGNWEVGARLLKKSTPDLRLMLYMGRRARDQIERLQKDDLTADGIRIVAVDQNGGSPLELVEGIGFIKSGGFVSMAGDMVWHPAQRAVAARFLGHRVMLPEAPFMLALVTGAPLYVFFAARTAARQYHFTLSAPVAVRADIRAQRREAVRQAAQAYVDQIERHLRRSPFEWYHFSTFLGPAIDEEVSDVV
jgi:predicted LPLAT superfamily acyltransferase